MLQFFASSYSLVFDMILFYILNLAFILCTVCVHLGLERRHLRSAPTRDHDAVSRWLGQRLPVVTRVRLHGESRVNNNPLYCLRHFFIFSILKIHANFAKEMLKMCGRMWSVTSLVIQNKSRKLFATVKMYTCRLRASVCSLLVYRIELQQWAHTRWR